MLNGKMSSGTHTVDFDSEAYDMPSGVYFCLLKTIRQSRTIRMIAIK